MHIDMNTEKAEILALEHLFDRVSPGGMIVLDDFGWIANANQCKDNRNILLNRCSNSSELGSDISLIVHEFLACSTT